MVINDCVAWLYVKAGFYHKGIEQYKKMILQDPGFGYMAHFELGRIYTWFINIPDKAIHHFHKVLEIDSSDIATHLELSYLYLRTGGFEKALSEREKCIHFEPNNAIQYKDYASLLSTLW